MRTVRSVILALLATLAVSAAADMAGGSAIVRTVSPNVLITVEPVPGMGELVQIQVLDGAYPADVLRRQIAALGESLGADIGRLDLIPPGQNGEPLRAFFTVSNIVDPALGDIRLQSLVRSFFDGPSDLALRSFSIKFIGVVPGANTTLGSYVSPGAALQAYFDSSEVTLEYRILVLADDPGQIEIPSRHDPGAASVPSGGRTPFQSNLMIALVAVAGVSAGALVYFALLGGRA